MKEHLKECLRNFFIIVTFINLAMYLLGMIFRPGQTFGYEVMLYPIVYGAIGTIPSVFVREKKEPTMKQFIARQLLAALLCTVLLLLFMFAGSPLTSDLIIMMAGVALSVIVITIAVDVISWILDSRTAKDMTDDLLMLQERVKG